MRMHDTCICLRAALIFDVKKFFFVNQGEPQKHAGSTNLNLSVPDVRLGWTNSLVQIVNYLLF